VGDSENRKTISALWLKQVELYPDDARVESSGALGSLGAKPAAILSLYALKPEHTFKLGDFIDGKMPPQTEVAQTQTLVSLR
jgi:hypothetical protein